MRVEIRPWEAKALRSMDAAFLNAIPEDKPSADPPKTVSSRPLSARMFDALFAGKGGKK